MFCERTSVGLDVHARSVVAAAIDGATGEVFRARLVPGPRRWSIGWIRSLPGPVAVVYESGPTGFGLARDLAAVRGAVRGRGRVEADSARRGIGSRPTPATRSTGEAAAFG